MSNGVGNRYVRTKGVLKIEICRKSDRDQLDYRSERELSAQTLVRVRLTTSMNNPVPAWQMIPSSPNVKPRLASLTQTYKQNWKNSVEMTRSE
jgi:hypothetical protein